MSVGYVQDILFMVHLQTPPGLTLVLCGVLCLIEVSQLDEAMDSGMRSTPLPAKGEFS